MGVLDTLWAHIRPDPNFKARTAEDSGALLAAMAGDLGFADEGPGRLPAHAPLLGAGDGGFQRFTRILRGPLGGTVRTAGDCALASFVYRFRRYVEHGGWGRRNMGEIPCVLVVVELVVPEEAFEGVYVQPKMQRHTYSGNRFPWEVRERKTSDAALHERYRVRVRNKQDEATARRLLEGGLSGFLAAYAIEPGFEVGKSFEGNVEIEGGKVYPKPGRVPGTWLCTFVERSLTTETEVWNLLEAARGLASRVVAAAG
jgi:hypothetical protein